MSRRTRTSNRRLLVVLAALVVLLLGSPAAGLAAASAADPESWASASYGYDVPAQVVVTTHDGARPAYALTTLTLCSRADASGATAIPRAATQSSTASIALRRATKGPGGGGTGGGAGRGGGVGPGGGGLSPGERVGIVREAFQRKGNYGLGQATRSEADELGMDFVGPGFSRSQSQPGILISRDGLRQYRPPSFKPNLGRTQANFERRFEPGGRFNANGHLDVP